MFLAYVSGYCAATTCDKYRLFAFEFCKSVKEQCFLRKIQQYLLKWIIFLVGFCRFHNMWMLHWLSQTVSLIINSRAQSCEVDYKIQIYIYDQHYPPPRSMCSLRHILLFAVIKEHGTCKHKTIQIEKQMSWNYHLELFPQSFLSIKASCLKSYWAWSHKWIAFEVQRMLKHQTVISLFIYLVYFGCRLLYVFSSSLAYFVIIRAKNVQIRVGASWKRYCCLTKLKYCYAISMPFCHVTMLLLFV